MPRKPRPDHMTLHLQSEETAAVRRIAALFPDGAVSINRIARLLVRAGVPVVEAQLKERAEQYIAAGKLVVPDDKEPTP